MTTEIDDLSALGEGRRARFSKEEIRLIVAAVERGNSRSQIIKRYGISKTTLSGWVKEYSSSAYRAKQKPLDATVRRSLFRAIVENAMTAEEAKRRYELSSVSLVKRYVVQTQRENDELRRLTLLMPTNEARPDAISTEDAAALKKALEAAELKIKALNTLIDVAEERFKIDIRKKPGAKQSTK